MPGSTIHCNIDVEDARQLEDENGWNKDGLSNIIHPPIDEEAHMSPPLDGNDLDLEAPAKNSCAAYSEP